MKSGYKMQILLSEGIPAGWVSQAVFVKYNKVNQLTAILSVFFFPL